MGTANFSDLRFRKMVGKFRRHESILHQIENPKETLPLHQDCIRNNYQWSQHPFYDGIHVPLGSYRSGHDLSDARHQYSALSSETQVRTLKYVL